MSRAGTLVDLDGTLVDSNYHHAIAWSRALRDHGYDAPLAAIHRLVGMGGSQLLDTLIGQSDADVEKSWQAHYEALVPEVRPFEGAADLLRALHDRGLTVVLATSSPQELLDQVWSKVGADDAVDQVITAGDVEAAKPEPDIFDVARKKAGLDRDLTVAIGDSVWDVEAAHNARLPCVTLEVGGFSRAELLEAGAAAVYRDPLDLTGHLDDEPIGNLLR